MEPFSKGLSSRIPIGDGKTESYLATGFFTKDLFSANPTIIIDEVNPILQDLQTSAGDETDEIV